MDFTLDENLGLSPEQTTAVIEAVTAHTDGIITEYSGKANKDAEGILEGAIKPIIELTGVQREHGQKVADYISLAGSSFVKGSKESYDRKVSEYEEKIKNATGDPELKAELQKAKDDLTSYKEKAAMFTEWEENDYKGKWEKAQGELTGLKESQAFESVKPNFPDSANQYEVKYKWDSFVKSVKENNNIVIVEGEYIAIDKENDMIRKSLKDLLSKEKELISLAEGRNVNGLGSKGSKSNLEGIPFSISPDATATERRDAINAYIFGELGMKKGDRAAALKFSELQKLIAEKTPAK